MSPKAPITALILAKNEERDIARCVASLQWCDEVVVVDDGSTDATAALAIENGARVVDHRFESFAKQRNWALSNAGLRNEWVLHFDADEVSTPMFANEVANAVKEAGPDQVAFAICRKTMFLDRWMRYSDGFPVWIMRVTRKGAIEFEDKGHGEVAIPSHIGYMRRIQEPMIHYLFSKGISNWIERHNRYSTAEAKLEFDRRMYVPWKSFFSRDGAQRRAAIRQLSRNMPCRPLLRFLYQYLFKFGFLDGVPGFLYCRMLATYEGWIVLKRRELELNQSGDSTSIEKSPSQPS
jgi:glycosyltransferase involved in cell wall biosynthesis